MKRRDRKSNESRQKNKRGDSQVESNDGSEILFETVATFTWKKIGKWRGEGGGGLNEMNEPVRQKKGIKKIMSESKSVRSYNLPYSRL